MVRLWELLVLDGFDHEMRHRSWRWGRYSVVPIILVCKLKTSFTWTDFAVGLRREMCAKSDTVPVACIQICMMLNGLVSVSGVDLAL